MFTSRLPVSTSVRRPNGPSTGSTSFAASNRLSGIPTTVRKANLFTPQTKRPTQASSLSTTGKSAFGTVKKYQTSTKPAPDRDQQMAMFDTLVDYLTANAPPQFPIPEAKKFFSSVSTTESSRIFEFLIGRTLPDFKVTKLEKDVPEALALLGYPYIRSVTKSALVSVTTRQAAVGLLVIFVWLITWLNCDDGSDDDEDIDTALLRQTLQDPNNMEGFDLELFQKTHPRRSTDNLQVPLANIQEELSSINQKLDRIDLLKQEERTFEENANEMSDYNAQMKKYTETLLEDEAASRLELKMLETEIEDSKKESSLIGEIEAESISRPHLKIDMNNLEASIMNIMEIKSAHKMTIEKLENGLRDIKKEYDRKEQLTAQTQDEISKLDKLYQERQEWPNALTKAIEEQERLIEKAKYDNQISADKNKQNLLAELDNHVKDARRIAAEAAREAELWEEVAAISEHNNKVAKQAVGLF